MVFPRNFHRIVVIGTLYTAERFNFSLSVAPVTPGSPDMGSSSQAFADEIAGRIAVWWPKALGSGGAGIIQAAVLQSVKVNRIGPDGKYVDGETYEGVAGPIQGGSGILVPPQLATAVTLVTNIPRGRGSKGRFYLPPLGAFSPVSSDGRLSAANAMSVAVGAKALVEDINDAYIDSPDFDGTHKVAVASNIGAGSFTEVGWVRVGRVVDTIRSRRSSLVEDYQEQNITI